MTMNVVMASAAGDLGECVDGAACSQDFNCEAGERCETGVCRRARPLCAPCDAERQCGLDPVSGLPNPCVEQDDGRVCALEENSALGAGGISSRPWRVLPAGGLRNAHGLFGRQRLPAGAALRSAPRRARALRRLLPRRHRLPRPGHLRRHHGALPPALRARLMRRQSGVP